MRKRRVVALSPTEVRYLGALPEPIEVRVRSILHLAEHRWQPEEGSAEHAKLVEWRKTYRTKGGQLHLHWDSSRCVSHGRGRWGPLMDDCILNGAEFEQADPLLKCQYCTREFENA